MKAKVYDILRERNLKSSNFNIEILCDAGIKEIVENIDFYYDKPYTCESVFKELFYRGVLSEIEKSLVK